MKKLEIIRHLASPNDPSYFLPRLNVEATLQAIIDRVNELSEEMEKAPVMGESTTLPPATYGTQGTIRQKRLLEGNNDENFVNGMKLNGSKHDFDGETTKRFKAEDVIIKPIYEGFKDTYYMVGTVYRTKAEAEAARDLLLNL
jgi:hypothetical protein